MKQNVKLNDKGGITMAVFVFSTGSILKKANVDAQIHLSINNRTSGTESYRVIVWNTSSGVKTSLFQQADDIAGNNTVKVDYTIPSSPDVSSFEIEIRLSNPHMAPYIQVKYTSQLQNSEFKEAIYAGELFYDSATNENP